VLSVERIISLVYITLLQPFIYVDAGESGMEKDHVIFSVNIAQKEENLEKCL
jgi:hypothetical protein